MNKTETEATDQTENTFSIILQNNQRKNIWQKY